VSSHQTRSGRPAGPSATLLVSSDRPESSWSYSGGQLGVGLAPPHSFLCLALQARWAAPQQLQRSPAPPVHAAAHPTAGCAASRAGILRCGRRERHARWDAAGAVCNTVAGVTGRPGGRLSRLDASVVRNPLTVMFFSRCLSLGALPVQAVNTLWMQRRCGYGHAGTVRPQRDAIPCESLHCSSGLRFRSAVWLAPQR
jgi:hypothetical protein